MSTSKRKGLKWDGVNSRLGLYVDGTKAADWGASVPASRKMSVTTYSTGGDYAITAAALAGGIIVRDPAGGNRTDTFPIATLIEAAIPGLAVGDSFPVYYINTADAAETITLAVATGTTITNVAQTITQNEAALLLFRKTATTPTFNVYIIGA